MSRKTKDLGGTTHWEGCETEHHDCALARLADERAHSERLAEALRASKEYGLAVWPEKVRALAEHERRTRT